MLRSLALASAFALLACAITGSDDGALTPEERWKLTILRSRTQADITNVVGRPPKSCEASTLGRQRCTWYRDFRSTDSVPLGEHSELVLTQTTGYALTVVCELPYGSGQRDKESCRTKLSR